MKDNQLVVSISSMKDIENITNKTKYIKSKGVITDEYQVVTAKKVFNDEKEPVSSINVRYEV